jgi:hypothetical protein
MARPYSAKFLKELHTAEATLGVTLGRVCYEAKIPASYVAAALETSRITVYGWFRGQEPRLKNRKVIQAFIDLVRIDTEEGRLPAKGVVDAKAYIEEMVGRKI